MPLERIHAYHLVRVLRMTIPAVVLALIGVFIWNYSNPPSDESPAVPTPPRLVENVSELFEEIKFSHSDTDGGHQAFTVEARTNLGLSDGNHILEDVTVTLFAEDGHTPERGIHGDRCGYNQASLNVQCDGNVELQIDPLTSGRTEALIYSHPSGTITTLDVTEILRPGQFQARSNQMSLRVDDDVLEIRGGVRIVMDGGAILTTEYARYLQDRELVEVSGGFQLVLSTGTVSGERAEINLTPGILQPVRVRAWTNVSLELAAAENHTVVTADEVSVGFSEGVVIEAQARGHASLVSADGTLSGDVLDARFDQFNRLQSIDSEGRAEMLLAGGERLRSARIRNELAGTVSTTEDAILEVGDYRLEGSYFYVERGDLILFRTNRPVVLAMPDGSSRSRETEATFDPDTRTLISLIQSGAVEFFEGERTAQADTVELHPGSDRIDLRGGAVIRDVVFQIEAAEISIERNAETFSAVGAVRTLWTDKSEPVMVWSQEAQGDENRIVFSGGADLWTGNTHVTAARLEVNPDRGNFLATQDVVSVLDDLRVWSERMEFDEQGGALHHSGGVRAIFDDIELSSDDLSATLQGGEPDEVHASGNVRLEGPEFRTQSDRAVYSRSKGTIELAGEESAVFDATNGMVAGCRLILEVETRDATVESEDECRVVTRRSVAP